MFYVTSVLCFLILLIENSEQTCKDFGNSTLCDSLDDLYATSVTIQKPLTVTSKTKTLKRLSVVPPETAANIEFLRVWEAINGFEEDAFKNFFKIQRIIFYDNNLKEIPTGIFRNLNVKILSFNGNGIKSIYPGSFDNLPKLETIRVENNNLTSIPKNIFNGLTVTTLSLSKNQISNVEDLAFGNMTNLRNLYLDNNRLAKFVVQESVGRTNLLDRLWLHRNGLTEVTNYMLEGLTDLKVLNLGFNSISNIEPKAFSATPKLKLLVLTHNALKILDGSILPPSGLPELETLYLDHNRLTFLSSNFLFRLNSLKGLSIGGNPWQCPCLDLVFRWLKDFDISLKCDKEFFSGTRPICVVPERPTVCTYSYNEDHYKLYREEYNMHPPPPFCML